MSDMTDVLAAAEKLARLWYERDYFPLPWKAADPIEQDCYRAMAMDQLPGDIA